MLQYLQYVAGRSPLGAAVALLPMPFVMVPVARNAPRVAEPARDATRGPRRPGAQRDRALPDVEVGGRPHVLALRGRARRLRGRHGPGRDAGDDGDRLLAAGREAGRGVGGQRHLARAGLRTRHRDPRQRARLRLPRRTGGVGCPRRSAGAGGGAGDLVDRVRPVRGRPARAAGSSRHDARRGSQAGLRRRDRAGAAGRRRRPGARRRGRRAPGPAADGRSSAPTPTPAPTARRQRRCRDWPRPTGSGSNLGPGSAGLDPAAARGPRRLRSAPVPDGSATGEGDARERARTGPGGRRATRARRPS